MSASPDVVIRHWFQEVWNERHEDAIDRLMTPAGPKQARLDDVT